MRVNWTMLVCISLCMVIAGEAQLGVRGQIFLPNGDTLRRNIRFIMATDDGARSEIMFTDSSGRIAISQPLNIPYTITVESDGETFDTTTASFDPTYSGRYITIHLRALKPRESRAPGLVSAGGTEQKVSPKAKEAYEEALKLLEARQYEKAVEPLKRAISLQADCFRAYNDLGVLYMRFKQFDQAADVLRQAVRINDKAYLPQLNLGIVLNQQRKYQESIEVLGKLARTIPLAADKINPPLIEALIGAQQWRQAEQELERGLALKTADTVDLKIKLGMVLIRQNKAPAAVAILQEASSAEPENALAQFNLGTALLQAGNLDEAETSLCRAYQLKGSEMPGAQLLLGELYFQKQDYRKAIEAFKNYLRDLPDAPNEAQVKAAIEKLSHAVSKQ